MSGFAMGLFNWGRKVSQPSQKLQDSRLVVFDVEATGLNPRSDQVIAIAAVSIQNGSIPLAGQFSSALRADKYSGPQAALAHRLDSQSIKDAPRPDAVLEKFHDYVGKAPSFAYHSAFDDEILKRAYKKSGIGRQWRTSLDVAQWLLWLHPELGPRPPTLDGALAFARIHTAGRRRHDALVDSMLTAQLVLTLMPATYSKGVSSWEELKDHIHVGNKLRHNRY